MKVFSIAVVFAALLFVAYGFPKAQEEGGEGEEQPPEHEHESGEEHSSDEDAESTTQDPCQQFEEQCVNNEDSINNGVGNGDNAGNNTMGNTTPSPQCRALEHQCHQQNNSTMPGGYTKPTPPQYYTSNPTQPPTPTAPSTQAVTHPTYPSGGRRR